MTAARTSPDLSAAHPTLDGTGLPALRLPPPDTPFTAGCASAPCRRHPGLPPDAGPVDDLAADPGALGWYRWMLGHHVAVCVWRLLCRHVPEVGASPRAGEAVADLYDAYSALLLYSGSCTPQTYATVIRARMRARHPAFSGTWARDHERVAALLGRARPLLGDRVARALKLNRVVHVAVGRRLVPKGKSLLRESGVDPMSTADADRDRFDEFFGIDRGDVCVDGFADQLTGRVALALADLAARPATADYGHDGVNRLQAELPFRLERLSASTTRLTKGTP